VLRAFFPALAKPDDAFAKEVLSPQEYRLYLTMDPRDRHHACEVARRVLGRAPLASGALVRAALLHDIGKSTAPYRPLHRIAIGLYLPKELPAEPRLGGWPGIWQLGLHHDRYGAEMIRAAGGSSRVAEIVARHHRPGGDREAQLLKDIDERF
jgi:putative nucleotidyltransferase with HDIG domain